MERVNTTMSCRPTLAACTWTHNLHVVRSCIQLSSLYGAMLLTRRHPACRCNLASSSSPVDILVRPGGSGNARDELRSETELLPSRDLVHGTVFLNSSLTAQLPAALDNTSRPTYFHHFSIARNSCTGSSLPPLTTLYNIVSFTLHYITVYITLDRVKYGSCIQKIQK